MSSVRESLAAIQALSLPDEVRIVNLCGDQERVIALSEMRRLLPSQVQLLAGPGCAASLCPESDVYQALRLVQRQKVTLLLTENMLRLPLRNRVGRVRSLLEAQQQGSDVRTVSAPVEAVLAAQSRPDREMVLFVAGFETLLAPLAGMVLEGLPPNLSILLCGRRVQPLVEQVLYSRSTVLDALLLPGNRCALTGTADWDRLSSRYRKPAAVAGYTAANILAAVASVLRQLSGDEARVDNLYRTLVRPEGNAIARDQLDRVFELVDGNWRGVGRVPGTAFRLRHAYDPVNADARFPDYRHELDAAGGEMPEGCECAQVVLGRKAPAECPQYQESCSPLTPYGPCMASEDAACFLRHGGPGLP